MPDGKHLDRVMRLNCFPELHDLFARAHAPAKELTESYSAVWHLRHLMADGDPVRVIHVGDGAHARTGAMFSFLTQARNISVDPDIRHSVVNGWRHKWDVERFAWIPRKVEDVYSVLNAMPASVRTIVTFVHAHVDVDEVLSNLNWHFAFTMSCCHRPIQLSRRYSEIARGQDWSCLSPHREYQVLANVEKQPGENT
jgi:hypothetical protein